MNKFFFFAFVGVIALFSRVPHVRAEDVLIFHFEQTGEKLSLDSQLAQPVVLENDPSFSIIEFSKNQVSGKYRIELSDVSGASAVLYEFSGESGKFSYKMPHFGIVNGYKIYSTKDSSLLLQGSLEGFVRCNANGMCEFEKGENMNTCLSDCTSGKFSPETQKLLKQSNDVIKDPKTGDILLRGIQPIPATPVGGTTTGATDGTNTIMLVMGGIALLLVGVGVWVLVKLRKKNKEYGL